MRSPVILGEGKRPILMFNRCMYNSVAKETSKAPSYLSDGLLHGYGYLKSLSRGQSPDQLLHA